ncbi:hypothetical protein B0H16DRAFT_1687304 [Mycena metata]|uniref:F-box domain-containing protein n=1 Tax=Mycena metata TaxID=1033252 RepID=A0AAD7NKJ9_9AGAR|nr:hypothetical protein B0H16DRAFT_1687304 [Mycena metata]
MSIESNLLFGSSRLKNIENQVQDLIEVAEANIRRLTAQIGELTAMRERERSVLSTLRLMVLPIGKLPPELLVEIFKIVVHTPTPIFADFGILPGPPVAQSSSALRRVHCLSQVSLYWRQIVHSTPQLWAEDIVTVSFDRQLTDRYLEGLDALLTRSTPWPISVSIACDTDPSTTLQSWQALAPIMLPTAMRWKTLQIDQGFLPHVESIPSGTLDALEWLLINHSENEPVSDLIVVFESSRRLRAFTLLSNSFYPSTIRSLRMPWLQLTHLDVSDPSMPGCRAALLQCGNLMWAKIYTSYDWDSPSPALDSPVTILPFLSTLDLEFTGSPNLEEVHGLEAFIIPLALPSLKTFMLELDINGEFWPTAAFTDFQSRSPHIENFALRYSMIDSQKLITLLRHSPSLTTLDITHCSECIDNYFLDVFRWDHTANSAPLVPKLEHLSLIDVGFSFDYGPFEEAIRSRWWKDGERVLPGGSSPPVSRLKAVSATRNDDEEYSYFGNSDTKSRMQELVDQGLNISLR